MNLLSVRALLQQAQARLQQAGSEDPLANAQFLLAHVMGVSRTWLEAFGEEEVPAAQQSLFEELLQRHEKGEPIAYIIGYQPFCSLDIRVTPDVLIPRPETEELAQWVGQAFEPQAAISVLDLCTGSGCLALALAQMYKNARITAADVSPKALQVARENARAFQLEKQIQFVQSNVFEKIEGRFDLIVSNPPYIPSGEIASLAREVKQEPLLALDGGEDGLKIVRVILEGLSTHAAPGCKLGMELCAGQPAQVALLLNALGWKADVKKDIFGIERFVTGYKI